MAEGDVGHGWNNQGANEVSPNDLFEDLLASDVDVLALPPLPRVELDTSVRNLIDGAFPDAKMKAHRDRLCQLLERRSYCSLAQLSKLYTSLVVGNPVLRTEAEKNFEELVLGHLCQNSKQDAHWDCFIRFLGDCQRAHAGARSKPAPHLATLAQQLSGFITRKMQATSDPVCVLGYQALLKAYFGDEREAEAIRDCWFEVAEVEKVCLRCAYPGCTHPHAFSVSKTSFERLFEHIHAVHIHLPEDADGKESRKRSAPSSAPAAAPARDATQRTLPSFLAQAKKRTAPARATEAPSDLETSSSATAPPPSSSF